MQLGAAIGLDADGAPVTIYMDEPVGQPVVALLRADRSFGTNPEAVRRQAPRHSRRTVSTWQDTYGGESAAVDPAGGATTQGISDCPPDELTCICFYDPSRPECNRDPLPPASPDGVTTPSRFEHFSCRNTGSYADNDADGLADQCEAELAYAFRPYLKIDPHDQDPRREPYWAAYPAENGANQIQLFYAISYYYDRGAWNFANWNPHQGDSEFVVVRMKYFSNGYWQVRSMFFAAHYKTVVDASEDMPYDRIEFPRAKRGRPTVYVSRDKHGSYRTDLQCDRGAYGTDTCDGNRLVIGDPTYEVEVLGSANLGNASLQYTNYSTGESRYYPGRTLRDCVSSRKIYSSRRECYWSGSEFRGWQTASGLYPNEPPASAYWTSMSPLLYRGTP